MLILVRHAPPFRLWHLRLGERLASAGHEVVYEAVGRPVGRALLALERRLYSVERDWDAPATTRSKPASAKAGPARVPELTLELAGASQGSDRALAFEVDGVPGERGLIAASRAGRAPCLSITDRTPQTLRLLAAGRPAMEDGEVSARALEHLLPRLVTLLIQAVTLHASGIPHTPVCFDEVPRPRWRYPIVFLASSLVCKLWRRAFPGRDQAEHWRLALRYGGGEFVLLPDDGSCFRADPFLFEDGGRSWLFYEEFPYATGKGVIGRVPLTPQHPALLSEVPGGERARIARDGNGASEEAGSRALSLAPGLFHLEAGACRVVLEDAFHLSYPLVLRHGGSIYMLPETSAASRVQLYRADPFPDRWLPDTVLIEGRRMADATPVFHQGQWWLFATSDEDGGSSWDELHLFHAPNLLGPWSPHVCNPVLIDAGAARPAGRMWHEDGVLMRPAQDCRTGYGVGLAICRVDRLDPNGFLQRVVERIVPPGGGNGVHTINRAADWETVDLKVSRQRRAGR